MKIVRRGALPVGGDSGLCGGPRRARGRLRARRGARGEVRARTSGRASSTRCSRSSTSPRSGRCASSIDAANGMAGVMLPPVLDRLPQLDVVRCYFEPDGTLPEPRAEPAPAREPRVHRREDDARRLPISASRTTATPTAASSWTTPASSSRATSRPRCIAEVDPRRGAGRRRSSTTSARAGRCRRRSSAPAALPLVNRVGHAFIKQRMREEDAVFAGEVSAHYYFREFSQADSGVVPFLADARARSRSAALKLSELLRPYRERYFLTGEINTPVADVALKLQELKERYRPEGPSLAPRRPLDRLRRLALQRPPVEHRAPAAAEPRGALERGADGRERDEVLAVIRCVGARERRARARSPDRTGGHRSSTPRSRASGSRTRMRRASSTTGATSPYFDHARTGVPPPSRRLSRLPAASS